MSCYKLIPQAGWYKEQKFLSHSWEVGSMQGPSLVRLLLACRWPPSPCVLHVGEERALWCLLMRTQTPL
jgi:hypothetical protein